MTSKIRKDGVLREIQENGETISEKVDRELIRPKEKDQFKTAYDNDNLKECIRLLALWATGEDPETEM